MSQSQPFPDFNASPQRRPGQTRRLLVTLGVSFVFLVAAWLVFSAPRLLALPSETTISQSVQTATQVGNNSYATYGEVVTVTLRFTITTGTVLTGPVEIGTRFTAPVTQLGLRFLGYQNPSGAGGTEPVLVPTSFVSPTVGNTTYLTWTFGTITNTSGVPYVYEIPYQVRFGWRGVEDAQTYIDILGTNTFIRWSPYTASDRKTAANLRIYRAIPNLNAPYSTKIVGGAIQGGGMVVYTVTLKNATAVASVSTAYDLVITDSLDAHLTYVGASPAPDSVSPIIPGQNTVLTWTVASLPPNTPTWVAYVTATLPATFTANALYTNTVYPSYTSLPGDQPDEGSFTNAIPRTVSAIVVGSKRANPATFVRIGDAVSYTVIITVPANAGMWSPIFTDTLPDGFNYRASTFSLTGATLSGAVVTKTSGTKEQIVWMIASLPPSASPQIFSAVYVADVTGLNMSGAAVFPPTTGQTNADNAVIGTWQSDVGEVISLGTALVGRATIAQPFFNSLSKIIKTWPLGSAEEVGSQVNYEITLINNGTITGYEVVLNDLLPPGMVFKQTVSVSPVGLNLLAQPAEGDTGTVQWFFQEIPGKTTVKVEFSAIVSDTARPGDTLSNTVSLIDYTSQPGEDTNPYDRHYANITNALPKANSVGFVLKGLNANKTDFPDPVLPNGTLTYTILYSNTSAEYAATNAVLIDHYDSWLDFNGASVTPSHDPVNHDLTWNVGDVPVSSGNSTIVATFTVKSDIDRTVRVLTNTISSDWDSPAPAMTRIVTTALVQPKPTITLDDQGIVAQAGKLITYTMIYSNAPAATGATVGTFTITLNHAEYVTYKTHTSTPTPNPPGPWLISTTGGHVIFTDTLQPGQARTIRIPMTVTKPLPYTLAVFTSTATIDDWASDATDSESEDTPVDIPRFTFYKVFLGAPPVTSQDTLPYQIFITNTGQVTATNIMITDVWDSNTYPVGSYTNWTLQPGQGVYATIPSLGPNKGIVLEQLTMKVTDTLPVNAQLIHNIANLTTAETTQQATSIDTPLVGLYIQKSHDPDPVYPGELLNYTIVYTTYAPAIVAPYISDTLPAEVIYVSCSGGDLCGYNNGQVTWNWSGLVQGNSGTVSVVVQAPNTEGITLTNVYASNGGGVTYREGPPDYTYVGRPHMFITKGAATVVNPIAPGDQIVYTLNYTNSGSYKATGVKVYDNLPANTTFVSCAGGAMCDLNGTTVTWDVGEVPAPGYGALTLVVQVNSNSGTTTIANSSYRLEADRNVSNENTPPTVNVSVVRPALTVVKSASQNWIALGGTITYTVRYTNTGGGTFTTVLFTDTIDSRLNILAVSANCAFDNVTKLVTCADNAGLIPSQAREFFIKVQAAALSNNEIVTNSVSYLAGNQTETLPEATTLPIEVLATNTGAAADFSGSPTSGGIGLNVTFTNLSGGSGITSCTWEFGDTVTSSAACQPGQTVNHAYAQPGTFSVKLTVTTGSGSNTRTRADYITVSGAAAYNVDIDSPQPAKSGTRGTQVVYTVVITNTGTVPDYFKIELPARSSYKWETIRSDLQTSLLLAQGVTTTQITVLIPETALLIASDVVTVTAISNGSSSVSDYVALKTSTIIYPVYLPLIRK